MTSSQQPILPLQNRPQTQSDNMAIIREEITSPQVEASPAGQSSASTSSGRNQTYSDLPPDPKPTKPGKSHDAKKAPRDDKKQYERDIARLREELDEVKKKLNEERRKRESRDAEVEGMRDYAIANDSAQGSDAIALINQINNLVENFAFGLSNDLDWKTKGEGDTYKPAKKLPPLESALAQCDPKHAHAQFLLQTAIQSHLLDVASEIMGQACYGKNEEFVSILGLEDHVQSSESQATFGRWRVLTYSALLAKVPYDEASLKKEYIPKVVSELLYYRQLLTGSKRVRSTSYLEELQRRTERIMADIVSHSIQFFSMVRTKIVSTNYCHYLPDAHELYNEEWMEASSPVTDRDKIAATVRLGLCSYERMREGSETNEVWVITLKAEVIPERELNEDSEPSGNTTSSPLVNTRTAHQGEDDKNRSR